MSIVYCFQHLCITKFVTKGHFALSMCAICVSQKEVPFKWGHMYMYKLSSLPNVLNRIECITFCIPWSTMAISGNAGMAIAAYYKCVNGPVSHCISWNISGGIWQIFWHFFCKKIAHFTLQFYSSNHENPSTHKDVDCISNLNLQFLAPVGESIGFRSLCAQ